MDAAGAETSPGQQPSARRRDRLRALVNFNTISRSSNHAQARPSLSRFSLSSLGLFSRRTNTSSSSTELEHEHDSAAVLHTRSPLSTLLSSSPVAAATADTGDLVARLNSLDDFFEDEDDDEQPEVREVPAAPTPVRNRASRRLSLRLRDLVDPRLLIPRNRAATAPSEPQSRFSYYERSDSTSSPMPSPPDHASIDNITSQDLPSISSPEYLRRTRVSNLGTILQTSSTQEEISDEDGRTHEQSYRRMARPRSVVEAPGASSTRAMRRATWGTGRPWPSMRPTEDLASSNASESSSQPTSGVPESLSTQSLASASPLSSLSSLFNRTTSTQSSSSTLTPGSSNGSRSPPVLRPGAARMATPTTTASTATSESNVEQTRESPVGRFERMQTRLRRQLDNMLSRRDSEAENNNELHSFLRAIGRTRTRGSDGSSNDGDQVMDGMAPFTIVGIRRVDPRNEGTNDEDFLPAYLRDLVEPANVSEDGATGSTRGPRHTTFRSGARRRVLSFYDRMESTNREEALQMLQRRRPRSLYGAGSSRRNGVVEPDSPTETDESLDDEDHDSSDQDETSNPGDPTYIIYLISGILPENHPLLSAPSLFTNNPTYEDMVYIASLLGPGKPPVASESDVASAPGLFVIELDPQGKLFAVSRENNERIALLSVVEDGVERAERCLVCLGDYEAEEEARKLVRCGHLFHKDCIDQWLTEGRNSCPLCRGDGVEEKPSSSSSTLRPSPTTDLFG